ncbi:hypothetical protein ACO0SA_002147 [Hanseniaspora valbyensis]
MGVLVNSNNHIQSKKPNSEKKLKRTSKYFNLSSLTLNKMQNLEPKLYPSDSETNLFSKDQNLIRSQFDNINLNNSINPSFIPGNYLNDYTSDSAIYKPKYQSALNQQQAPSSSDTILPNSIPKNFSNSSLAQNYKFYSINNLQTSNLYNNNNTNNNSNTNSGNNNNNNVLLSPHSAGKLGTASIFIQQPQEKQHLVPNNPPSYLANWNGSNNSFNLNLLQSQLQANLLVPPTSMNGNNNNNESLMFKNNRDFMDQNMLNYKQQAAMQMNTNNNELHNQTGINDFEYLLRPKVKKIYKPKKKICPTCEKALSSKFALENHLRTHTHEKPFCCSFSNCKKCFSTAFNRDRHIKTHEKALTTLGVSVEEFKSIALNR